jgi:hypothetical protein
LGAVRLEILREMVPATARIAVLINPADAANSETILKDVEAATRSMGLQIQVLNANTSHESLLNDLRVASKELAGFPR